MLTMALSIQPAADVPYTVYVRLTAGVAVTGEPVVALKSVAGVHVYVLAPLAVSIVALPAQTVGFEALAVMVGNALTVIVTLALSIQPAAEVPITV